MNPRINIGGSRPRSSTHWPFYNAPGVRKTSSKTNGVMICSYAAFLYVFTQALRRHTTARRCKHVVSSRSLPKWDEEHAISCRTSFARAQQFAMREFAPRIRRGGNFYENSAYISGFMYLEHLGVYGQTLVSNQSYIVFKPH